MHEGARPRRATGIVEETINDTLVLTVPSSETVHTLNATATFIFAACDGTQTLEAIVSAVATRYGVPADRVAGDVIATIAQLVTKGLILS